MSEVVLFSSCLVRWFLPHIRRRAVQLLRELGHAVREPWAWTCCGQPFYSVGHEAAARTLYARWRELARSDEVVCLSGSCAAMLEKARRRWGGPKVRTVAAFLLEHADRLRATSREVWVHTGCHMLRDLGERDTLRQLLGRTGAEVHEANEDCCGFGGLFSVWLPSVARAMGRRKRAALPGLVVTADPGCLLQLRGAGARVRHLVEVLRCG